MKRLFYLLVTLTAGFSIWLMTMQLATFDAEVPDPDLSQLHPLLLKAIGADRVKVLENPGSPDAWGELGSVFFLHGFPEQARECFIQAGRLDPDDFRWPYLTGVSFESSSFDDSIGYYQTAINLRADYLPLRLRLAQLYLRTGRVEQCQELISTTPARQANDPHLLVTSGRLALVKSDYDLAEESLEKAIAQQGWSARPAYLELVKIARMRNESSKAEEYQRSLELLPSVAKMEFADPVLENLQKKEGLSRELAQQADLARARGDYTSAIRDYEAFLKIRPEMASAWINLAQCYAQAGSSEQALTLLRKCADRFGESVITNSSLALTYEQIGDHESALKHYRKVLEIKPDHKQTLFSIGLLEQRRGNLDISEEYYRRAIDADVSFAQPYLALGVLLMSQNRREEARPFIERAAQLVPDDPVPISYLNQLNESDSRRTTDE